MHEGMGRKEGEYGKERIGGYGTGRKQEKYGKERRRVREGYNLRIGEGYNWRIREG